MKNDFKHTTNVGIKHELRCSDEQNSKCTKIFEKFNKDSNWSKATTALRNVLFMDFKLFFYSMHEKISRGHFIYYVLCIAKTGHQTWYIFYLFCPNRLSGGVKV